MSDRNRFGFNSYYTSHSLRNYHPSSNPSYSSPSTSTKWTSSPRSKIPMYSSLDSPRVVSRPLSSRKSSDSDVEESRSNKINLLSNKVTYSVSKKTDSESDEGKSLLSRFLPSPKGKYAVNRKSDSEDEKTKQNSLFTALTTRVPSPKNSICNLLSNRGSYTLAKKRSESPSPVRVEPPRSPGGYSLKKLRSVVSVKGRESSESVADDSSGEEEESSEEEDSSDDEVYTIDRATSPKPKPTTQDPLSISATAVKPRSIRPNVNGRHVGVQTENQTNKSPTPDPPTKNSINTQKPYEGRYRPYLGAATSVSSRYSPISVIPRLDTRFSTYTPKVLPYSRLTNSFKSKSPESDSKKSNTSYRVGTKDFRKSPLNMNVDHASLDPLRTDSPPTRMSTIRNRSPEFKSSSISPTSPIYSSNLSPKSTLPLPLSSSSTYSSKPLPRTSTPPKDSQWLQPAPKYRLSETQTDSHPTQTVATIISSPITVDESYCHAHSELIKDDDSSKEITTSFTIKLKNNPQICESTSTMIDSNHNIESSTPVFNGNLMKVKLCQSTDQASSLSFSNIRSVESAEKVDRGSVSSSSSDEEESKEESESSISSSNESGSPVVLVEQDSSECSSDQEGTVPSSFKIMEMSYSCKGDMISDSFTHVSPVKELSKELSHSDKPQEWWVRPNRFDSSQVPWWVNEDDSLEESPEQPSPEHEEDFSIRDEAIEVHSNGEKSLQQTFHKGSSHKGWLEEFSEPSSPSERKKTPIEEELDFWSQINTNDQPKPLKVPKPHDNTEEETDFWWIKPTPPSEMHASPVNEGSVTGWLSSPVPDSNAEPSWPDAGTRQETSLPDESVSNVLKKSPSQIPWWDNEVDYETPNDAPPLIPEEPVDIIDPPRTSVSTLGTVMKLPRTETESPELDDKGGCHSKITDTQNGALIDHDGHSKALEDATFQLFKDGDFSSYLDLESSVDEQTEEFEGFTDSYRNSLVIRTQLSVRVHTIIEKLLNSTGRELRRSLFVLKQIFQEDKDLIPEFVQNGGLACLIKIGTESDQTFQNYILRALGQLMLYVDGMNGVMEHNETVQWLYGLTSSSHRLVVKTAIKLLLVFVDYAESNCSLLVKAISTVHTKKEAGKPWSLLMNILCDIDNADWEIILYAMTLINKTLNGLPDQDLYYDQTDNLEELGIQNTIQRYMNRQGVDLDLLNQFHIYESVLKHEDGDNNDNLLFLDEKIRPLLKTRRSCGKTGGNKRKSRRHSAELINSINNGNLSPTSPTYDPGPIMNGMTPALRRRRERVERQKYLIREQEENQRIDGSKDVIKTETNGICDNLNHLKSNESDLCNAPTKSCDNDPENSNFMIGSQEQNTEEPKDRVALAGIVSKAKQELERSKSRQEIIPIEGLSPTTPMSPKKSDNELQWDTLLSNLSRPLIICDLDFSDLKNDQLEIATASLAPDPQSCPPPPPPPKGFGLVPPPPPTYLGPSPPPMPNSNKNLLPPISPSPSTPQKNKKTIKLFWKEVPSTGISNNTIWDNTQQIKIDTHKLEHLFENRAKDIVKEKQQEHTKAKELTVLDPKRSNAINIAMTKLPPGRTIKTAILKMDASIMNREGIEKLLGLLPSEEEKQKIIEASVSNPDVPLGSAEQFLLTLGSINEIQARLMLWAFRLDFDILEKEVAEPLMDLKQGIEQLQQNQTFSVIMFTLLTVGNFLNGSQSKGFYLEYLSKVPEVKDTVHKHSLLYHLCHLVIQNFPNTSDLYSEIGPLTRASKVDFSEIFNNLQKMEQDCKASWDHLKSIAKHDPNIKLKMKEFVLDAAERIILLKQIHLKVINRFKKFLAWLGYSFSQIEDCDIQGVCKVISEFALEYRTARDRVQQQLIKKANHRQRNKTRGKLITDFSGVNGVNVIKNKENDAEQQLHKVLTGKQETYEKPKRDTFAGYKDLISGDSQGEILESLVKTATISSQHRPNRLRKRSKHAERKSMRRTLKNGLLDDDK